MVPSGEGARSTLDVTKNNCCVFAIILMAEFVIVLNFKPIKFQASNNIKFPIRILGFGCYIISDSYNVIIWYESSESGAIIR